MPPIEKYTAHGRTLWKIDVWVKLPSGRRERVRQRQIPTKQMAEAIVAKVRTEAFENRFTDRYQQRFTVGRHGNSTSRRPWTRTHPATATPAGPRTSCATSGGCGSWTSPRTTSTSTGAGGNGS